MKMKMYQKTQSLAGIKKLLGELCVICSAEIDRFTGETTSFHWMTEVSKYLQPWGTPSPHTEPLQHCGVCPTHISETFSVTDRVYTRLAGILATAAWLIATKQSLNVARQNLIKTLTQVHLNQECKLLIKKIQKTMKRNCTIDTCKTDNKKWLNQVFDFQVKWLVQMSQAEIATTIT